MAQETIDATVTAEVAHSDPRVDPDVCERLAVARATSDISVAT